MERHFNFDFDDDPVGEFRKHINSTLDCIKGTLQERKSNVIIYCVPEISSMRDDELCYKDSKQKYSTKVRCIIPNSEFNKPSKVYRIKLLGDICILYYFFCWLKDV